MKKKGTSASFGVIGLGRFGSALVECLASSGKEVIAVDKDEAKVKEARRFTDYAMVVEALDRESLEEAGMQNCDTVVICIGEQVDVSILATMTALKMNVPHVLPKPTVSSMGRYSNSWGLGWSIRKGIWPSVWARV